MIIYVWIVISLNSTSRLFYYMNWYIPFSYLTHLEKFGVTSIRKSFT